MSLLPSQQQQRQYTKPVLKSPEVQEFFNKIYAFRVQSKQFSPGEYTCGPDTLVRVPSGHIESIDAYINGHVIDPIELLCVQFYKIESDTDFHYEKKAVMFNVLGSRIFYNIDVIEIFDGRTGSNSSDHDLTWQIFQSMLEKYTPTSFWHQSKRNQILSGLHITNSGKSLVIYIYFDDTSRENGIEAKLECTIDPACIFNQVFIQP